MALRNVVWILALASTACGSEPDVVAVGQIEAESDAGAGGAPVVLPATGQDCEAGDYVGRFHGLIGLGPTFAIQGTISFRLMPSRSGTSEFLEITQSALSGATDADQTITAEVMNESGAGCREGTFSADLVNGMFAGAFPFTGVVTGTYDATLSRFTGNWEAYSDTQQVGYGGWGAFLFPESAYGQ